MPVSGAVPLIAAALVVMGSPGPATMSVTAVGAAFGWRRAQPWLWGVALGTGAVLLAVAMGVVAMLLSVPRLAPVLLVASAGYMLWLAWMIATAPPLAVPGRDSIAPSFAGGFLLGIGNPKAYLAIGAVFAGSTLAVGPKTALLAAMIVLIHVAWLLAGTALARLLRDPMWSRVANLAFAALLAASAALALLG